MFPEKMSSFDKHYILVGTPHGKEAHSEHFALHIYIGTLGPRVGEAS